MQTNIAGTCNHKCLHTITAHNTHNLQWWQSKCPLEPRPDTNSVELAQWVLGRYHEMCEEKEKVDPFDHRVKAPRGQ